MRRIDRFPNLRTGVAIALLLACAAPAAGAVGTALTADTQVNLGRRFEARGDTETALGLYQKAVNERPNDEAALRALVGLAVRTNRAGAVYEHAARLAEIHPRDGEAQVWLAASLNEKARPAEALTALERAETAGPGAYAGLLWTQRGIAHDLLGNALEAQRAFSHAITLNPGEWRLPMRLALSLALQGDYPAALRILQMQVNDPAMEQPVRETLAIIYALSGQTEQAMEIARSATDKDLADSQRGYLALLPTLPPAARAYAAHYRRIDESMAAKAPISAPAPTPESGPVLPQKPAEAPEVKAEPQDPEPQPVAAQVAAPKARVSGAGYWLQLASLVSREKAVQAWDEAVGRAGAVLNERAAFVQTATQGDTTYHRLMTGPFETLAQARNFAARLGAQGIKPVIKRDVGDIEPMNR